MLYSVKTATFIFFLVALFADDPYQEAREEMVNTQISARGIKDEATLQAMRTVERHRFVPEAYKGNAYDDRPLPIGHGQTISQPYIVAYMTATIEPQPDFKVLEIGTGSGYQAAVLAEIVDEVYTIEIIPELGEMASQRLTELGYENVHTKIADGYHGWEEHAPFDAIIVTAAAEYIPPPLVQQLKEEGKMMIPVGSAFLTQQLMMVTKKNEKTRTRSLMPVRFVPFKRNTP